MACILDADTRTLYLHFDQLRHHASICGHKGYPLARVRNDERSAELPLVDSRCRLVKLPVAHLESEELQKKKKMN